MSNYGVFAEYYDNLTRNIDYKERALYFDKLIKKHNGKKELLLDLACGTGSLSEELCRLGYDVIGVDNSPEMLNIAMDKKFDSGLNIQYLCQDMTELDMYGTIDVTICALDSLNHLPDKESIYKAVSKVSLFADPNGLFIFDVNMPFKHKHILANNTFVYDTENVYCVWQNSYFEDENNRVDISLDFFEKNGDIYTRYSEDFSEIAISHGEIEEIISKAGMKIVGYYDYDTENEPNDKSEKIVYVAKKI